MKDNENISKTTFEDGYLQDKCVGILKTKKEETGKAAKD